MQILTSVVGLDLGSHTIKAVELRQTLRDVEPAQLRVHPRPAGGAPLSELLPRFFRMHQLPTERIVACVPGDRLSVRRMEFPFRDRKRLAQAVPFEVEAETPFDLSEVLVDWELVGGDRDHAQLTVCIAPRSVVAARLAELAEAGCQPRILEAEGVVLANLAPAFGWSDTRLIADIGHQRTSFCVVRDGVPLSARTIALGGRHITEAVAQDHGVEFDEAEATKCEDGIFSRGFDSTSPRALGVLDRLAREAVRTIESVAGVLGGGGSQKIAGIALVGGSARLHRLDEYLSERTGIPAARPQVPPEGEGAALLAAGDPALFAPALALALRGTARGKTRTNFRQEEFGYRTDLRNLFGRDLRPTAMLAGGVAAIALVSGATSMAIDSRRADSANIEVARLYSAAVPGAELPANPVRALADRIDEARELADFLGVYGGNHSAFNLLGELSRRVPQDLDIQFDEVNIAGRVIRIKVSAKTFEASERLTRAIAASPPFESAEVTGSIETKKGGSKAFTVAISLTGSSRAPS
jgi:general secretion pathway protein L